MKTQNSQLMIRHPFQQNSTQKNIRISSLPNHRAHPPENRRAHPPENHRLIVNPSARPDQVQGGGGTAAVSSLSLSLSHLAFVAGLGFLGGFCRLGLLGVGHGV